MDDDDESRKVFQVADTSLQVDLNGFCVKNVSMKLISTQNIDPSLDEIELFQKGRGGGATAQAAARSDDDDDNGGGGSGNIASNAKKNKELVNAARTEKSKILYSIFLKKNEKKNQYLYFLFAVIMAAKKRKGDLRRGDRIIVIQGAMKNIVGNIMAM